MHLVAVLALDGVIAFDMSVPLQVLGRVRLPDGRPAYQLITVATDDEVHAGPFVLRASHGLDSLARADTIIVPGVADLSSVTPEPVLAALRSAAAAGTRIVSICVGAFTLAEAGLLDGRRASTHWKAAAELGRRYPRVAVDADVLYIDDGQILTSAGAAAGLDLCLYLVRRDHGAAVAGHAARDAVMPLERDGGQAQFIVHEAPTGDGNSLGSLMSRLEENVDLDWTLGAMAAHVGVSTRTLSRRFREQTGTTPLQWLHRARLRHAQYLLETTSHPVERIAAQVGFPSPSTFRQRFRLVVGTSPNAYRRAFRPAEHRSAS